MLQNFTQPWWSAYREVGEVMRGAAGGHTDTGTRRPQGVQTSPRSKESALVSDPKGLG